MKCPKCDYTSFDFHEMCPKCGKDLREERTRLGLPGFRPATPVGLETGREAESYIPGLGNQEESAPENHGHHEEIAFPGPPAAPPAPEVTESGLTEPDVLSRPEIDPFSEGAPPPPPVSGDEDPFSVDLKALGFEGEEEPEEKSS